MHISVVITLRADFYAHCADYIQLREALAQNQEYIGAMNEEELRRAIEEPARPGRWELEPGLVDLLLHDVGNQPGALPLLSHALFETWQRRRGRTMTLGGYPSSGSVQRRHRRNGRNCVHRPVHPRTTIHCTQDFSAFDRIGRRNIHCRRTRRATFNELILKPEDTVATHAVLKVLADAELVTMKYSV